MRSSVFSISLGRATAALCLSAASMAATAGFVLVPSTSAVLPGGSFQVTLSYSDSDSSLALGNVDVNLTSSIGNRLTLDSVALPAGSPVDPSFVLVGPVTCPPNEPALPFYCVSAILDAGSVVDWSSGADLLTFNFTVGLGPAGGSLNLQAGGRFGTTDFEEFNWMAPTSVAVVPEVGTLPSVLIGLAALALLRRGALARRLSPSRPAP